MASDPLKLAKMRAIQRAYSECHAAGRCGAVDEPNIAGFLHYSLKLFEHTWGGSLGTGAVLHRVVLGQYCTG